ncbi:MAG: PHP domain-containing protein [Desulfovibrio sp.]|jgi:predicted metal-dependent phosphoesterase TrpH|nr:PHP domain-containing protein [Desulfovibrio sp.]
MSGRHVDLHTHSSASDGSDPPALLVRKAAILGLEAVALTDHDTVDGLEEAAVEADRLAIRLIPGCELAVREPRLGEIHLLGLWVPASSRTLREALAVIREHRIQRNRRMLDKLRALGMPLEEEDLPARPPGAAPGRPHIARALLDKGYVRDISSAFSLYLGEEKAAFVPRILPGPREGIRLLAGEGATVVLAHPFLHPGMTPELLGDILGRWRAWGLDALEVYHSSHSSGHVRQALLLADRYGLLPTGGSDYHGEFKSDAVLGKPRVPAALLDRLEEYRRTGSKAGSRPAARSPRGAVTPG